MIFLPRPPRVLGLWCVPSHPEGIWILRNENIKKWKKGSRKESCYFLQPLAQSKENSWIPYILFSYFNFISNMRFCTQKGGQLHKEFQVRHNTSGVGAQCTRAALWRVWGGSGRTWQEQWFWGGINVTNFISSLGYLFKRWIIQSL